MARNYALLLLLVGSLSVGSLACGGSGSGGGNATQSVSVSKDITAADGGTVLRPWYHRHRGR